MTQETLLPKSKSFDSDITIAVLGEKNVGKTTMVMRFLGQQASDALLEQHKLDKIASETKNSNTVTCEKYLIEMTHMKKQYNVHIWDVSGNMSHQDVFNYIRHVDAFMIVYDAKHAASYMTVHDLLKRIKFSKSFAHECLADDVRDKYNCAFFPTVLCMNKIDAAASQVLQEARQCGMELVAKHVLTTSKQQQQAKEEVMERYLVEMSALDDIQCDVALDSIVRQVLQYRLLKDAADVGNQKVQRKRGSGFMLGLGQYLTSVSDSDDHQ